VEEEEAKETQDEQKPAKKRSRRHTVQQSQSQTSQSSNNSASLPILTSEKLKDFKSILFKLFHKERTQALPINSIIDYVKEANKKFVDNDVKSALNTMQDDNQVMISDDTVFLI